MKKTVYICDRCGKELEDEYKNEEILYREEFGKDGSSTIHFLKMYGHDIFGEFKTIDYQMSFCDECKEEIVKFFNTPFLEAENAKCQKAKANYESNIMEYMKKQTMDCFKEVKQNDR